MRLEPRTLILDCSIVSICFSIEFDTQHSLVGGDPGGSGLSSSSNMARKKSRKRDIMAGLAVWVSCAGVQCASPGIRVRYKQE